MYNIPESLKDEILKYGNLINDFRNNKIGAKEFKAIRVPMGIYEQRKDDTYMVRVRCVAGYITPSQLKAVGQIAEENDGDLIHITTRQEIQVQNLQLENTLKVLTELYKIGLASRGGGGNTVRNIMTSIDAGISGNEPFDVTPYSAALTNFLISQPDSWTLPRKFKISFSGSTKDNGYAIFNDLGFIADIKDGRKGFKVYLGGSLGSNPMIGHLLLDFIPAEDILYVADAAKKLFSRYGNRRNKHKARLRYVFYKLGKEKVFQIFHEIYSEVRESEKLDLIFPKDDLFQIQNPEIDAQIVSSSEYTKWKSRYVSPQPADGLASVVIPFEHGNVEPKILISLASFLENFGNNTIRFSMRQNIHLRNIPNEYLGNIYNLLHEFDVETEVPLLINNLVACTGADTCRLGICLAKGASSQLRHSLRKSEIDLDKLSDFRINISGCPNSCGQQSAADLGFYGKVGRTDRMYPAYNVVAGGTSGEENTALAEKICEISARDLPELTSQILEDYSAKTDQYKSFKSYLESEGRELLISLSNKYKNIPNWRDDKNYYYDWGSDNVFSLVGKGLGECSAGLFDMIDVDLNSIKSHQSEIKATKDAEKINISLHGIVFSAARMLLVTKGVEPKSIKDVYELFIKNFIEDGLVSDKYRFIIENVIKDDYSDLTPLKDDIYDLARIVIDLYDSLDDSLQFKIEKVGPKEKQIEESSTILKKDFRGVACPMNFVKTKLALATIKTGEVLEIYLDDGEPIENVPGSVKGEGHKIISQTRIGDYWSVVIKKS